MTEAVVLEGIAKTHQGGQVLKIEKMHLARGEVLAIHGPNGAGKSTLLRIVGLVERPDRDRGRLSVLGCEPKWGNYTRLRRRMATVFQTPYMFNQTVFENIALGLRWRNAGLREINERVREVGELLEIDFLERPADKLSRGQAQRVALARALAVVPEILLLDEPLSALDADIRAKMLAGLKDVVAKSGRSAIYVTHDKHETTIIADRQLFLKNGEFAGPAD